MEAFTKDVISDLIEKVAFSQKLSSVEKDYATNNLSFFISAAPQTLVFKEGSKEDSSMYMLLSGHAHVILDQGDSPFTLLSAGDLFGELAFITGCARTADVVTTSESLLWKMDKAFLDNAPIELREKIKDKLIAKLAGLMIQSH